MGRAGTGAAMRGAAASAGGARAAGTAGTLDRIVATPSTAIPECIGRWDTVRWDTVRWGMGQWDMVLWDMVLWGTAVMAALEDMAVMVGPAVITTKPRVLITS